MGEEAQQQQSLPQTPKKRGRPRKIVERTESEVKEEEAAEVTESQSKKLKTTEEQQRDDDDDEEEPQQEQNPQAKAEASSASMGGPKKGEGQSVSLKEPPTRKTRRKSKPRKSS
ncbi:uncharacterized protein DDB_G0286299-like [Hibiscus syriacus]|uniref:uncharacterized protein DDB_G0286299-like n=1 Tax=Hibiscus syriacus TaxID=106335 RepID=UPI0019240EF0|nr:uncharacterized protein DDB_G0286299-like [Hibiscus syriacus]